MKAPLFPSPPSGGSGRLRLRQPVEGGSSTPSSSPPSGGSGRLPSAAADRGGFLGGRDTRTSRALLFSPTRGEWAAAVCGSRSRGVPPVEKTEGPLAPSSSPHQGGVGGCRLRQPVEGGSSAKKRKDLSRPLPFSPTRGEWAAAVCGSRSRGVPPRRDPLRPGSSAAGPPLPEGEEKSPLLFSPTRGEWAAAVCGSRSRGVPPRRNGRTSRALFFSPIRGEWAAAVCGSRSRGVPRRRHPLRPGSFAAGPPLPEGEEKSALFFSPIRGEWAAAVCGSRSRGVPRRRHPLRPGSFATGPPLPEGEEKNRVTLSDPAASLPGHLSLRERKRAGTPLTYSSPR